MYILLYIQTLQKEAAHCIYCYIYRRCRRKLGSVYTAICTDTAEGSWAEETDAKFLPSTRLVCLSSQLNKQISPHEKKNRNNYIKANSNNSEKRNMSRGHISACAQTLNCTGFLVRDPPGRHLIQVHSSNSRLFTPLSPVCLIFKVFGSMHPMITFGDFHILFSTVVINFSLKVLRDCPPESSCKST